MSDQDILIGSCVSVVLGLIPAVIAKRKGYPFFGWWILGSLLLIVVLPAAIFAKRRLPPSLAACPACSNSVSKQAMSCPHCGHPLAAVAG